MIELIKSTVLGLAILTMSVILAGLIILVIVNVVTFLESSGISLYTLFILGFVLGVSYIIGETTRNA